MRHAPINPRLFVENRERLRKLLPPGSLAVLNANDIPVTNADGVLTLVPNSDLFYLTGIEQEESRLLIFPDAHEEKQREILFLREANPELERWEGHKLTKDEARAISGIDQVHWLSDFAKLFHRLMCECAQVYLNTNEHKRAVVEVETRDARFIAETRRQYPLHTYQRLAPLMHRLRVAKSPLEVELIKKASDITGQGFERVLRFVRPGVNEMEVEAEFAHEFIRNGAKFAYNPIIASGPSACVLHYISNQNPCKDGELLLLDVAASYANYNADMTRTIPVNGKFSKRQRQVYEAVLKSLRQCAAALKPGKLWKEWQLESEAIVAEECVGLGLLKARQVKAQKKDAPAVKTYFMHGVGHPLGLDVHDLGLMNEPMQEGWVMTIEPAIYIPQEKMAVRLENDYLITAEGAVDLMADIPIEADEITALMK